MVIKLMQWIWTEIKMIWESFWQKAKMCGSFSQVDILMWESLNETWKIYTVSMIKARGKKLKVPVDPN